MKRALCLLSVLFALAPIYATGIGPAVCGQWGAVLDGSVSPVMGVSLGCSVKLDRLPIYWTVHTGAFFWGDSFQEKSAFDLTVTGDYWIINPQFAPLWKWYLGAGAAASGGIGTDNYAAVGPRLCIGVNTYLADGFTEVFMQCAAQGQAVFAQSGVYARVTVPVEAGMRLWF